MVRRGKELLNTPVEDDWYREKPRRKEAAGIVSRSDGVTEAEVSRGGWNPKRCSIEAKRN